MNYRKELSPGVILTVPGELPYSGPREVLASESRINLFRQISDAMPDESKIPVSPKIPQVQELKSFEELYAQRRQYQSFDYSFVRHPEITNMFTRERELHEVLKKAGINIFDELINGYFALAERNISKPIFWGPNSFPYKLPANTLHRVLWYEHGVEQEERAWFLSDLFENEGVGEKDFVIVTNPIFARSAPQHGHDHLFIRRKPTYKDLLLSGWENIDNF